jgi:hypothetical protein
MFWLSTLCLHPLNPWLDYWNSFQTSLPSSTLLVHFPHGDQGNLLQMKMWPCVIGLQKSVLKTKSKLHRFQKAFQFPFVCFNVIGHCFLALLVFPLCRWKPDFREAM